MPAASRPYRLAAGILATTLGFAATSYADPQASSGASPAPAAQSSPAIVRLPPVQVTATRANATPDNSTSYVTVFTNEDVNQTPSIVTDDALRFVPGFNTFRRSSSIVTAPADDPEAQGVTLRGVGPGGASRALVLLDGVPVNDGYGGWIYWDELPLNDIDRVEIVEGGGSDLWGNDAEGGVINIISKQPAPTSNVQVLGSYGSHNTTQDAMSGEWVQGPLKVTLEQDFFNTSGWSIIKSGFRGAADHAASSLHTLSGARVDFTPGNGLTAFVRGSFYQEYRDLGTSFRSASATREFMNGGGTYDDGVGDLFNATAYAHISTYHENFSMENGMRSAETPSQTERIPSTDVGGFLSWSREIFERNTLAAGGDFRFIEGTSYDNFYDPTGTFFTDHRVSSGRQQFYGAYLEDIWRPLDKFEADVSVRGDVFTNYDGKVFDHETTGPSTVQTFSNRVRSATSPRLGLRYDPWKWLTLRFGVYEAYRAPTLAELYRQSTVEDLVLSPNPRLRPEYLEGGEIGGQLHTIPGFPGFTFGLTGYWDYLHDPINNVVTATNPITGADAARTRENLGRARIRGYQVDSEYNFPWIYWGEWTQYHPQVSLTAQYLRSEATLTSSPPDSTLVGRRLALVPWDTISVGLRYSDELLGEFWVQEEYEGKQWEDSDNHDLQAQYWLTNLSWTRQIPKLSNLPGVENGTMFVKIQNLMNRQYIIDLGGDIPKIGTPITVMGGMTVPLNF
jgi:iron complex outermembrane receptor protein